jgi:amino acid permease
MKAPTYIGVISLFVVVLIIIIQSPYFIDNYYDEIYKKDDKSTHLNVYDLSKGADKDLNIIRPFVTLFFAYTSQNALFPIIEVLKDRTKKKVDKIFYISSIIDCLIYILIGILGYLTQPIDTPDLIIERKSIFKKDYFMIIGRMLLTLTLIGKIAPNFNAMRSTLLSSFGYDTNNYSNFLNCIITIPSVLVSTLITVLYQKVGDYVDFLGSFSSIFFCFTIPYFFLYFFLLKHSGVSF